MSSFFPSLFRLHFLLKVQTLILIPYTLVEFSDWFPTSSCACSVWCSYTVLALQMGKKHSGSGRATNNPSQSTWCFRSTEGRGFIVLAVQHKYQQPIANMNTCLRFWLDSMYEWSACPFFSSLPFPSPSFYPSTGPASSRWGPPLSWVPVRREFSHATVALCLL